MEQAFKRALGYHKDERKREEYLGWKSERRKKEKESERNRSSFFVFSFTKKKKTITIKNNNVFQGLLLLHCRPDGPKAKLRLLQRRLEYPGGTFPDRHGKRINGRNEQCR